MDINNKNKTAFEFFQSIYDLGVNEIEQYIILTGATKFNYFRLYQGGNYFLFSNDRDFTEQCHFNLHENSPVFMKIIRGVAETVPFYYASPLVKSTDHMLQRFNDLGWGRQNIIYCRHGNYVDGITFAADNHNESGWYVCENNIALLKNLYWIIRDKMTALVPFSQPGVLSHFRNGCDIAYQPVKYVFHLPSLEKKVYSFLEDLSRKNLALTPREWEVCKGLARGETAKETARILNLHHRTIQDHLSSMYQKFGTIFGHKPTKSQIINHLFHIMDKDLIIKSIWEPALKSPTDDAQDR